MPSFYARKQDSDNAFRREVLRNQITTTYSEHLSSSVNPSDFIEGLVNLSRLGLLDFFKRQKVSFIDALAKHPAPIQACAGLIAMYELELFRYGTYLEDRANLDAVMQAPPQNDAAKGVAGLLFILKKNSILSAENRKKVLAHAKPWELYSAWINDFGSILLTLKTPNAQWVFDAVAAHTAPQEAIILLLLLADLGLVKDPATAQKNMLAALHCKAPALLTKALIHLKQTGLGSEDKHFEERLPTLCVAENPWDMALEVSGHTKKACSPVAGALTSFGLLSSQPALAEEHQIVHEPNDFKLTSL
jgi:hypothetical protein